MTSETTPRAMAVRATRRWTLVGVDGATDVELTAADDATLGHVLARVGALLGTEPPSLWAGSARLDEGTPLTAPDLAHGAVLGMNRPVPRSAAGNRASALELHVVGGPDAGRAIPLGQGRHVLGRGSEATIRLDDPDVSRRHVAVQVGGGQITVADLSSTNGSRLDDQDLDERPVSWPVGAVLRFGASAITVAGPGGAAAALEPAPGGRLRLRPAQRMTAPRPDVEVSFPRPPEPPPKRKLAWVAVALPAVAGVLMAWLLHTPTFLFFALLSPVVALGTWLSDRWSGRRSGRQATAAHAVALLEAQNRLAGAVRAGLRAAEAAHPDLATLTGGARRRSHLLWSRSRGDADALTVRVGSGPGHVGVTRVEPDGGRRPESAPHVPAVVDLRTSGGLAVIGPRERATGVLHGVLAQLTALHPPGEVDVVLLLEADRLPDWSWTRWLPHVADGAVHVRTARDSGTDAQRDDEDLHAWLSGVTAGRRAAAARPGSASTALPGWLVVVVDRPLDARLTAALRAARDVGVVTLAAADAVEDLPVTVEAALRLTGETGDVGVLGRQGVPDQGSVLVDRLPRAAAAQFARDLAALTPVTAARSLPRRVRLLDLPGAGLKLEDDGTVTGAWSRARDRLTTTVGRTAEGPVELDLCRQGPHALIAGTTGSGKSELLQTLIAGLALNHPPDRCSFLLVDYKGGAAFAEAAALPHTVGLVTDLDGQSTARALRSLGAELTRREAVLSAHSVSDIAALPDDVDLARLVIVVDEFATLAEELPGFVPGLVSIAQRGRSLGVHLVLATQRPAGVVSPEIRANCTLRICLRTTDETDSRDVLGTPEAAYLPVDVPGRALLRFGSGNPVAVQIARVASAAVPTGDAEPEVRRWCWPHPPQRPVAPSAPGQDTDLARLCRALVRSARAAAVRLPHRPWRPPLPELLPAESLDGPDQGTHHHVAHGIDPEPPGRPRDTRLRIGLVDRPDSQTQEPLELDLAAGGAWLAVGGPRSGRTTLLTTVLNESVRRLGPADLHVHVLEAGTGALGTAASALPHTGTTVGGEDVLRTVRLVDRLAQEVAARRAGAAAGSTWPLILLLVDGAESVCAVLDDADPGRGSTQFLRLIRDGAAVGVTCVLTSDRAVPGGRLAAVAGQRLVLPLPDRADYAVAGVPARAVPGHRPPGRALLGEEALECQLALPRPAAPGTAPDGWFPRALHIAELPSDPVLDGTPDGRRDLPPGDAGSVLLPVGPGGDTGDVLTVDLLRTGGLLVTGPPGSGRSTALHAFGAHLRAAGVPVLHVGTAPETDLEWVDARDEAGVAAWVAALDGRPGVVIADDLGSPAECPALGRLPALGRRGGVSLVAASAAGQLSGHYQGPVASLRRGRSGLLLCPGPGDADLLGMRLPRTPLPVRPGSGWLVTGAGMERVQVARRRAAREAGPSVGVGAR